MDKLPEYLRETVDWFMGKTRRKGDRGECGTTEDGSEQKLYLQLPLLECRIPEPDLIFLSDLPGGLDYNEWLASHTIGFFEHVNLTYGTVSEYCMLSSCPEMVGPGPRNYCWIDEKGKKTRLSAPQYVDYVMTYCQKTINDETVFPTKHGNEFPVGFEVTYIRKMIRLLFHVLAHVYHSHFKEIVLLQLHAHLNALFAHFVGFSVRFNLLEDKELEVMADLVDALKILPSSSPDVTDIAGGANGNASPDAKATDSSMNSASADDASPPSAPHGMEDNKENNLVDLTDPVPSSSNHDNVTTMEVELSTAAAQVSSAVAAELSPSQTAPAESSATDAEKV